MSSAAEYSRKLSAPGACSPLGIRLAGSAPWSINFAAISRFSATRGTVWRERIPLPYLGVLPFRADFQPESEDSLCRDAEERGDGDKLAWIRFPHLSNSQDCQPWTLDGGVRVQWARTPIV